MKNLIKISFIFCLWFLALLSFGQTDCKVLKAEISLIYKGDCKNGFAHGDGDASGRDHYIGEFKKGLPHGKGTYDWSTGEIYEGYWRKGLRHGAGNYSFFSNGMDTTITGRWVNDEYVGEKSSTQTYKVLYKDNIGRIKFVRFGGGGDIRIRFLQSGGEIPVQNPMLSGDSGTMKIERFFTGFENAEFPFTGKVVFYAPSVWGASIMRCELRFEINEPGKWDVYIYL
ncbi:MAG: hypothetical protein IMY71_14285 [Bacteroidetes bacterium]|nr:hypothetical protein [Bacteroidota bacterium]